MFRKVLVANRGEIACRVIRTLDRMGIASVAVCSEVDRHARHVRLAREAVLVGAGPALDSYLRSERIIEAARALGAEAIHPGYGFLSEDADFAQACADAGIAFIGPRVAHLRAFGLKHEARALADRAAVPTLPGSALLADAESARKAAREIGYPVMLKSTAGGGGIGLRSCRSEAEIDDAFAAVQRLAAANFGTGGAFLEKFVARARHIEVQIFGDGRGRVAALGARDCSIQRRNQKIIEETPPPGIPKDRLASLCESAVRLGQAVDYANAGTVEFIYDADAGRFYFLEVNTRLQVEHGVTEAVTGIDLVEWMIRQAAGESLDLSVPAASGAAIEARIYAEDPGRDFRPQTGILTCVEFPSDVRVDHWIDPGTEVTPYYDPLLAKLIVAGRDRNEALARLRDALGRTAIAGLESNLCYLRQIAACPEFESASMTTASLNAFSYAPRTIEVESAGTQTTIQDHPGRQGYWHVGVPPSGPMDDLSFRLGNRAVGNSDHSAGLEITLSGPRLKFNSAARICLTGAEMPARIGAKPVPFWEPVEIAAGAVLEIGNVASAGCRAYLAIAGGLDCPLYLGSRATFTLGKFGGHAGRALQLGDILHFGASAGTPQSIAPELRPRIGHDWEIGVYYGPHGAPDFFTAADIDEFFSATFEVHYHSNRTGIRLIGPKPRWARADGGEAGLHPSNIHDNAYAIGAVDYTGDMPVILGPDGPSLGGFVCPATVASDELWKLGQLRPKDRVRFRRLRPAEGADDCVLGRIAAGQGRPDVVYRRSGDRYLLIEYGPEALDLEMRFRIHALMQWIELRAIGGIIDLTPGIRSLQIHFDPGRLSLPALLSILRAAEAELPPTEEIEIPTRIVHLPLSWDDPAIREAIAKYAQSVRSDAPWCPSNIEFIRRINGLEDVEEVRRIIFEASYLVLGLGDVYLGAPVATPLDPRHRLVTTKYNPARTWTPENAVGIGGAYMCVYGMEGPGGYQLFGRTCQMWNTYATGDPWLLRFFDQIRFYPVSDQALLEFRDAFRHGRIALQITESVFRLKDYRAFLATHAQSIRHAKARQQAAFEAESARWKSAGQAVPVSDLLAEPDPPASEIAPDAIGVQSPVAGSVWRIEVELGQPVKAGEILALVESMKMEIQVTAPADGIVDEIRAAEGRSVDLAQILIVLRP